MQLETIKNSLFALNAAQAAAIVGGGGIAPADDLDVADPSSGGSFHTEDTFYLNGTVKPDKVQHD